MHYRWLFFACIVAIAGTRSSASRADGPPPSPYSIPFQLRPAAAATVLRSDNSFDSYENNVAKKGFGFVSELTGAYRIPGTGEGKGNGLAPLVKLTIVSDSPPSPLNGGFAFVNPLVGGTYAMAFGSGFRGSAFLGLTVPVGMGGGDTPDKGQKEARVSGVPIRAGLDNSLFAVNDFAVIPGIDIAYVSGGLTVQGEATLFQLWRVRGAADQPEASKTNLTMGLHLGYFFADVISVGAELRYQRWLNAPIAVDHNLPGTSVDLTSMAVGPRFHFKVGEGVWIRPALAYVRGFDAPMSKPRNDNIIQLDVPVVF
jgi:hypothetical protein